MRRTGVLVDVGLVCGLLVAVVFVRAKVAVVLIVWGAFVGIAFAAVGIVIIGLRVDVIVCELLSACPRQRISVLTVLTATW